MGFKWDSSMVAPVPRIDRQTGFDWESPLRGELRDDLIHANTMMVL